VVKKVKKTFNHETHEKELKKFPVLKNSEWQFHQRRREMSGKQRRVAN
jgi:hypothetical protein